MVLDRLVGSSASNHTRPAFHIPVTEGAWCGHRECCSLVHAAQCCEILEHTVLCWGEQQRLGWSLDDHCEMGWADLSGGGLQREVVGPGLQDRCWNEKILLSCGRFASVIAISSGVR